MSDCSAQCTYVRMGQDKIEQLYYVMYVCMRSRTCQRRAHPPLGGSEAMYLLQTQLMFTVELAKAIDIVLSLSVKVLRSVHESLECTRRLKRQLMLIGGIHN